MARPAIFYSGCGVSRLAGIGAAYGWGPVCMEEVGRAVVYQEMSSLAGRMPFPNVVQDMQCDSATGGPGHLDLQGRPFVFFAILCRRCPMRPNLLIPRPSQPTSSNYTATSRAPLPLLVPVDSISPCIVRYKDKR